MIYKLSRGEISVANFIPPANGASQGDYFLTKNKKLAALKQKNSLTKTALAANSAIFFTWFLVLVR